MIEVEHMNRIADLSTFRAGAVAACLASAGLVLAACSTSNSPASNTNTPASSSSSSSSGAGSSSSGSGNSGSGSTVVSSNSVPFPVAVGNTWVYRQYVNGAGTGLQTNKITAIKPTGGGQKVYMGRTYYIFHSDGSITLPLNQFKTNGAVIKVLKGTLEWPPASVISSGQPTSSTIQLSATVAGQALNATAHVTVRGEGTQSVTVPAGTYSATIVDMTEAFTVLGHTGTIEIKTWDAAGVGPVQTEVLSGLAGAQTLTSKTELVSFKHG
jgi:hypothetical protein